MTTLSYATPIRELVSEVDVPVDFVSTSDGLLSPLLDKLFFTQYAVVASPEGAGLAIELVVAGEAAIALPGLDGFAFVFGGNGAGATLIDATLFIGQRGLNARLDNVTVALRFPPTILKPMPEIAGEEPPPYAQVEVHGSIILDENFNVRFEGFDVLSLKPVMIGNSGVVIAAEDIMLDFSRTETLPEITAAGFGDDFLGIYIGKARVTLPEGLPELVPEDLVLEKAAIGSGGVSGELEAHYSPTYDAINKRFVGSGASTLFGIPFGLEDAELRLKQNAFEESKITGRILLPFFEEPVSVTIGVDLNGQLAVKLAGDDGLVTLAKPGILSIELNSIGFDVVDGVFAAKLSGRVRPHFGGLEWPSFQVKELAIDSEGNVRLEGGWLDLREQYSLDFKGFKLEITKLGFGKTDDGGKWIGLSGGLKLAEGLPAGASVEGLRLTWYEDGREPKLTFNGVGVEFEVPEVLSFKGAVSYSGRVDVDLGGGAVEHVERFDGAIKLNLKSLNMQVDGTLVVGSASGARGSYNFFAVYLGAELPAGIPLWSTGLALYGMAGLFALQMEPSRNPNEGWYENPDRSPGWYKRGEPGVVDLKSKWGPNPGSVAFGAGVTIGTLPDNGTTFHGKLLFLMVFPGPILMLEGRGDLLKERAELEKPTSEPLFRALAVLDNRAGNLTVGLDAQYRYAEKGELIDIRGGVEAFFDFRNADAWHLYLGEREPRERRIRARALSLFEANAYFMLDARRLAMGAWIGYDNRWRFGPLSVTLQAWMEGNAVLSFKPPQFHGDLWVHGSVALRAGPVSLGLTVDARIEADVFRPFHLMGEFSVSLDLPWPLPDPSATIRLEWGPERVLPPLPLPLKEIAVEHLKVTTSWPLPRDNLLLPNYDMGDGFVKDPLPPPADENARPPEQLPAVPLDGRPHLTFGRHVNDDARVGVNVQPEVRERIGDPARNEGPVSARYGLKEVALERWNAQAGHPRGGTWSPVAWAPNPDERTKLHGSWAPVPPAPEAEAEGAVAAQTKLWLWSKTPFDYSRHSSRAWNEWFTDRVSGYPCVVEGQEREVCCGFEAMGLGPGLDSPWQCPGASGITLSWGTPEDQPAPVTMLDSPVDGLDRALCLPAFLPAGGPNEIAIELSSPGEAVRVTLLGLGDVEAIGYGADGEQLAYDSSSSDTDPRQVLEVRHQGLVRVVVRRTIFIGLTASGRDNWSQVCLLRVCVVRGGTEACCDFRAIDPSEFPVIVPWQCTDHPQIILNTTDPENGRCVARYLRDPVAGLNKVLCFEIVGSELVAEPVAIELTEPTRALRITLANPAGVTATGYDDADHPDPAEPVLGSPGQPHLTLVGESIKRVVLRREGADLQICLAEVCVLATEDLNKHLQSELVRWRQEDAVLEPYTTYRLTTVTTIDARGEGELAGHSRIETLKEYAFFRTEGPPGMAERTPQDAVLELQSGLEDLTRYVRHTVPDTVPRPGEKPPLPRPVYRAYDVGVRFNENYVELMYRLARRDLGLYLYDNNDLPVRDVEGRLVTLSNRWGRAEEATLTEDEERWLYLLDRSDCVPVEQLPKVLGDTRLVSAAEDQVLEADTLYEARLVPLLLHEDFSEDLSGWRAAGGALADWELRGHDTLAGRAATVAETVVNLDGTPDLTGVDPNFDFVVLGSDTARPFGRYRIVSVDNVAKRVTVNGSPRLSASPSTWEIPKLGAAVTRTDAETTLVRNGSGGWRDYRLSAILRSSGEKPAGLVFRYRDDSRDHYRFAMDGGAPSGGRRRLEKVVGGVVSVLASKDGFGHEPNRDYLVTVEAVGPMLRVYQDGALVFEETDGSIAGGGVGLYSGGGALTRFADVRVDDFGEAAPAAYRFSFTTSRFANFFHHLHSFQDETWLEELAPGTDVAAAVAASTPLESPPPMEAESRAYETLARQVLGSAAAQDPPEVEVTRVERDGEALTLLVRGPEPIDWKRTGIELRHADRLVPVPSPPAEIKLTDVTFGSSQPNDESVTLLLREDTQLTGRRVEYRTLGVPVLDEPFDAEVPGRWTFVDEGDQEGPSNWEVDGGELRQTSNIHGGDTDAPEKPGTLALAGDTAWADYSLSITLRSDNTEGVIGAVFRYQDKENYYRFSMGQTPGHRRLIRKSGGTVSVLWEDNEGYDPGRGYDLTVECVGGRLTGYLDDMRIFEVEGDGPTSGRVGLYCWRNPGARFAEVRVTPSVWAPYYTFGDEPHLPAGTRVRVYAGNAVDAPPQEPGLVQRFVATGTDTGQLRLLPEGAELRLAPSGGAEGHARYFLPEEAYAAVDARLLREADGTGFFVLVPASSPAGTQLAAGEYRIRLTYRRDNRSADPESLVLSEAGNSAAERVTIDVPWHTR